MKKKNWFAQNWLILVTGLIVGIAAVVLAKLGNPGNMGFCIACFERDIAGAFKLQTGGPAYFRPEIVGIVLGSMIMALATKEFKGKGGSSPLLRFGLGMIVMIGALVFLGCPLRMVIRIGSGDLNAVVGLVGFVVGILAGVVFLKKGFTLGRAHDQSKLEAVAFPCGLTVAYIVAMIFTAVGAVGVFAASAKGPGSMYAPWFVSLIAGLVVGALAQRSRFCMVGGVRNAVMFKDFGLIAGFGVVIVTVLLGNVILSTFKGFAFEGQPIAHTDGVWNFLGMTVVGWGSVLLGGCPLRQLILAGEGNSDSGVTVLGMVVGAALSHNFNLASSGTGSTGSGHVATIACLVLLLIISVVLTFFKKEKAK